VFNKSQIPSEHNICVQTHTQTHNNYVCGSNDMQTHSMTWVWWYISGWKCD